MYLKLKLHCFSSTPYEQQREGLDWSVRCFASRALITTGCGFCKVLEQLEAQSGKSSLTIPVTNCNDLSCLPLLSVYLVVIIAEIWNQSRCSHTNTRAPISLSCTSIFSSRCFWQLCFALFGNSHRCHSLLYFPLFLFPHLCFPHTFYSSPNFRALYSFPPSALSPVLSHRSPQHLVCASLL